MARKIRCAKGGCRHCGKRIWPGQHEYPLGAHIDCSDKALDDMLMKKLREVEKEFEKLIEIMEARR